MIRAMLFDMDGVLVQNEKLKALSVALAVQRLRGLPDPIRRASRRTGIWWGHLGKWFHAIS